MSRKKSASSKDTNIKVGNITEVSGNVNIAGGNVTTNQITSGLSTENIKQLFYQLYSAIKANSEASLTDKEDLKAEVEKIQSTVTEAVQGNKKADESFLSRRFLNIARVAPDVLDVVVTTLANPLAGLGITAKKIAEKVRQEIKDE